MEGEQTLKETPASSTGGRSSSDLVSTVELAERAAAEADAEPEGAKKTGDLEGGKKAEEKAEVDKETKPKEEAKPKAEEGAQKTEEELRAEAEAKEKAEQERFDKHPRFQKLIREKNELVERLARTEGKMEALETQIATREREQPDYVDITTKTNEELDKWRDEDPKSFYANLAKQARTEVRAELLEEFKDQRSDNEAKSLEDKQVETYERYAEDHPDFDEMWDSGEIGRYMRQHPGHNAISAHMMLVAEKAAEKQPATAVSKDDLDKQISDAVKTAEEKLIADIKAKGLASVLGAGPTGAVRQSEEPSPEMKDTKKHGGMTSVLLSRLRARRAAREASV